MAIEIPTGTTQFQIQEEGVTYILKAGSTRSASGGDSVIFGDGTVDNDKVIINGTVSQTGTGFGVQLSGLDMIVQVGANGSISGATGVELTGSNATVTNAGAITGSDPFGYGVYFEGSNTEISNTGDIISQGTGIFALGPNSSINNDGKVQGQTGINIEDARVDVTIGDHGKVIGTDAAIFSESAEATDKIHILNNGKITGQNGSFAIELGDSDDNVVNHGAIVGKIYLGTGKDVFDARSGTVDHAVAGGTGDDTLITDQASVKLKENGGSEGFDTVKSTVNYTLSANVERLVLLGHDNLTGKGNTDGNWLMGNSGDNKLFGIDGGGSDTFIFKTGGGHDTLMDFDAGTDKVDVSKWQGMDNFNDIKQHASDVGGDVHITLGSDELIIQDTHKADLHAGDFLFHVV
jgi:hypothetical protein